MSVVSGGGRDVACSRERGGARVFDDAEAGEAGSWRGDVACDGCPRPRLARVGNREGREATVGGGGGGEKRSDGRHLNHRCLIWQIAVRVTRTRYYLIISILIIKIQIN
jgi:hypothetical protein